MPRSNYTQPDSAAAESAARSRSAAGAGARRPPTAQMPPADFLLRCSLRRLARVCMVALASGATEQSVNY